ncbi:E3 ubiquitin-protein ligase RNF14-like [Mytilus californianus]|uniref:E3 ubiquitin-protein ligase RNF14-like n=1 Tax=Mytilus californianus TaxID=6549 RepID=UPI0022472772|nr:E3 ubiquitin-protein ligase RNF14-like [Mytilus californianus]XP_052096514.1 E3 ubiquitin-protein ligase RNF14-like [Mytilus californianus]
MPILNTWIDWLEHNTLSYLGVEDGVNLQISRGCSGECDERVGFEFNNIEETLNDLFRYNQQEEAVDFLYHDQECSICFAEKSGHDFYSFLPCKHYYCKECVAAFCSIHVKDGTVQQLLCLESNCKTEIKPYIMKEVLDEEEYKRWEQLTFQKGLDAMGDISYCPRCEIALITEENSLNMAHCVTCQFTFCLECSEPVHPGEICFFKKENNLKEEEERKNREGENEKEFQRKLKRMEEVKSHDFLKEKSKKCPVCKVKIIKAGGCNHVICTVCKSSMCWACGKDTTQDSYKHFQESPDCSLYIFDENLPVTNEPPMKIQELNTALGLGKTIDHAMCPECTENNLRKENINHVICWKCSTNFCYLCRKRLYPPIGRHFLRTKCSRYSDN